MEWYQCTIEELRKHGLFIVNDAVENFVDAFNNTDDEMAAYDKFESAAEEVIDSYEFYPYGNHYYLYLFLDGSVYYDANEGIDCFYDSLDDLANEDEDIATWAKKNNREI